jgi:hypothetical protein
MGERRTKLKSATNFKNANMQKMCVGTACSVAGTANFQVWNLVLAAIPYPDSRYKGNIIYIKWYLHENITFTVRNIHLLKNHGLENK